MAIPVPELTTTEVVALVNAWGTLPCTTEGRASGAAGGFPGDGGAPGPDELTPLADELHPIFATADPAAAAAAVTALLQVTAVRPTLDARAGELREAWTVDDPTQVLRAAAALALRHQLVAHPGRIGVCADDQCADVFVDASPAGRRRFCCLTCQNRARAAAFRRRHAR